MDKDRNYISPGKDTGSGGYGRRIRPYREQDDEYHSGYDIDRAQRELNEKLSSQKRKRNAERLQKKKRRRSMRIRALLACAAAVLIILIVLFLTPLLNIRNFTAAGNSIISAEDILSRLEPLKGKNLITLSEKDVEEQLSDLSYVESVSIAKFLIPPTARITITECTPAARIVLNGYNVILDPQLKILSDSNEFDPEVLPHIDGLSVAKYTVGTTLELADDSDEKLDVLRICLDTFDKLDMIEKIDYIDLSDITSIRFGYDDRIDALCGTRLELERKIRMFNVTVNSSSLADNARGEIDLSTVGKAVYTP